ncbi:hypothetical protein TRFO_25129 [Tritrichomonas foetus]|uniref:BEACH domain-containing protein n=1 Tax=Tritrichomonas foetus TaxID=1144522 RepID=A0A1J4K755_9EUKA|nr:hypothetical protein TRFO_25129 [Tritrichomonas foetus]|eukprot:OHT06818.1 hypothetical protein TRFO_25129 [Tritrichomonas foetus]
MTWIGRTLRSFSVSGSSAIRFLSDGTKNPEGKRFHEMVRDLDKNGTPHPCVDYFIEHFGMYEIIELHELRINREVTYVVTQFLPLFPEQFSDSNLLNRGFLFLDKAIFIFNPDQKNILILFNFIFDILDTNKEAILSRSMVFVTKCLSIQSLASLFFQNDALINLWQSLFIKNPMTCQFYGPLFTATAEGVQIKNYELYKPFFAQVVESFKTMQINHDTAQNSISFLAIIASKINSGNFFTEFFVVSNVFFINFSSLSTFSTFLNCKTHDPDAPWNGLNEICKNEYASINLLESALEVVHEFLYSPMIVKFHFNSFIKRAKELSYESQKLLFDIIERFPLSSKLDFYTFSTPPWDTGIDSNMLCQMVKRNDWGRYAAVMLSTLALKPEYNDFKENLVKDDNIADMTQTLIDITSPKEEISMVLYHEFVKLAYENVEIAVHCVERIAENNNVIIYVEQFLNVLQENIVCDKVFDIYSKIARRNLVFVLSFLENEGISVLFPSLKSDSSLDFLASLASNGPYDAIDNYIAEHFEESELSNMSEDKLKKLMMGLPQNSNSTGLLRIPSLLKYVKNIELLTQNDRFVFGINAHKYGVDTKENLKKCAPTFIDQKQALNICRDPDMLLHITSPIYPHFTVFECHKDAPHCTATFKLEVSTSFWIFIESVSDKTVILSAPFGEIYIDKNNLNTNNNSDIETTTESNNENSENCENIEKSEENSSNYVVSFFGQPPLEIEAQKWHLVTLTATEWTFQQQQIVCYFDAVKINETNGEVGSIVTFGSEYENNAVYYFSASIQTSDSVLNSLDVKEIYKNGPNVFCPTSIKMKPGFQFVPYKGIAKYIERLGGQEFIFILMRLTNNSEDLLKLLKSAFNLLHLNLVKENFFFIALRYILILKEDLLNDQFEKVIYHEFEVDPSKKWSYSMQLFCDYNILSSHNSAFTLKLLPEIIDSSEDSSQLFHFLVDSFIAFDLSQKVEENILRAINIFVNANPSILNMLLLVISAAAHIESNDIASLNDEKILSKQETLFQIIVDHLDLFTQHIKFDHALVYISTLRDEMALDLLQMIAKICIINPTYFELDTFRKFTPLLFLLSKYQKLWQILLIFYTAQSADSIDDFADVDIFRPQMTDLILDLLAYYIRFELSTKVKNPYSFQVVKSIVKLMISAHINFGDYLDQIQRLSSLGFDQELPQPIAFSIDDDVIPPKFLQKIQSPRGKGNEPVRLTRIHALDPSMFEETTVFLSKFDPPQMNDFNIFNLNTLSSSTKNISLKTSVQSNTDQNNFQNYSSISENLPVPEEIEEYAKSEAVQIIANLVAMVFVQKANLGLLNNKFMVRFLINSADVNPLISAIMHRKIVFAIFAATPSLNEENYDVFVKFVTNRVCEGWWNDDLSVLFQASFLRKTKATKHLVLACIYQSTSIETQIRILKELCTTSEFLEYLNDSGFYDCYVRLVGRVELTSSPLFQDLRNELLEVLPPSLPFTEAVKNNNISEWLENLPSCMLLFNEIKKQTSSSSKAIRDIRIDLTKMPVYHNYLKYQSTRLGNAAYIRRAFRFQFFNRFNTSNLEIEASIASIFQKEFRIRTSENPPTKRMIVAAPHPLCVPQKMVAQCYDFPMPSGKLHGGHIPHSTHSHAFESPIVEISESRYAPKSFEGWKLPSHVCDNNFTSTASLLLSFLGATSNLFNCQFLMSPESLQSVAAFNNNSFFILLNSSLDEDGELTLLGASDILCHLAVIENAVHGIYGESKLFMHHPVIKFQFTDVLIAIPRRFVYQNQEVDLYFVNGLHLTLILKESDRKILLSHLRPPQKMISSFGPFYAISLLVKPLEKVMKMWEHSELSTYDYLLYLNTISGRSFNDFSQYPVFPWILGDFNFEQPVLKRDLSKPMGAQTESREQRFLNTYNETEPHCHYGTHYSHPAAVLHYMMRCEPFTLYNLYLHSGMDHRDRQFSSIVESWRSASEANLSDLKELIPEFYTFPMMFENPNNIDFKTRSDGTSLGTVVMPTWAANTMQFIWQMRISLECIETSTKIGNWIDLIFGYKQRGQAAIDAMNVFQPLTYDTAFNSNDMNEEQRKAMIDTINQFGQCPAQLFTSPHPECERIARKTIVNSKFIITQLNSFIHNSTTIQFQKDMLFALPKYEHYVGTSFTFARVWDNYIEYGKSLIDSVDSCSATCLSQDRLILAAASRHGIIDVHSCINGQITRINRLISPTFDITCLAISTQHALLCGVSHKHIQLFDYTTGLLMKKISIDDRVLQVLFDDSSNFIVTISTNLFCIYDFDLRLVVRSESFTPNFTCMCTSDSSFWSDRPIYITGHNDGSVYAWRADILKQRLFPTLIMQNTKTAITTVSLFSNERAAIAADANGSAYLASIVPMHDLFISSRAFDKCRICSSSIKGGIGYRCTTCGLYVCKQCVVTKRPAICSMCKSKFSNETIDKGAEEEDTAERSESLPIESTNSSIDILVERQQQQVHQQQASLTEKVSEEDIGTVTLQYRDDVFSRFQNQRIPCSFPVSYRHSI